MLGGAEGWQGGRGYDSCAQDHIYSHLIILLIIFFLTHAFCEHMGWVRGAGGCWENFGNDNCLQNHIYSYPLIFLLFSYLLMSLWGWVRVDAGRGWGMKGREGVLGQLPPVSYLLIQSFYSLFSSFLMIFVSTFDELGVGVDARGRIMGDSQWQLPPESH